MLQKSINIIIITLVFSFVTFIIETTILDMWGLYLFLGKISYNFNICRDEYTIIDGGYLGDIATCCIFVFNCAIITYITFKLLFKNSHE